MRRLERKFLIFICATCAVLLGLLLWPDVHPSTPSANSALSAPQPLSDKDTDTPVLDSKPNLTVIVQQKSLGYSGRTLGGETPPKKGGRFLIYECVSDVDLCGGWADRQEGLVTVFLLAYLTNRRFGIRMDTPCEMTKFVVPNKYDWIVPEPEIQGKTTRHIPAVDELSFCNETHTEDFNTKYTEDVVFLQTNRDLFKEITTNPHYRGVLPSWAKQSRAEFFRDVWHTLMKPTLHLQQRLEKFLQSMHYFNRTLPLFGLHVRAGASQHFADTLHDDKLSRIGVLWEFVQRYVDNGSDVFVATDNPAIRRSSMETFGSRHHDTAAILRHIDRQRSNPAICFAFGGVIFDQLILTRCDVLVVAPLSGFSNRAAMIRGMNQQLFQFDRSVAPVDMYTLCDPLC